MTWNIKIALCLVMTCTALLLRWWCTHGGWMALLPVTPRKTKADRQATRQWHVILSGNRKGEGKGVTALLFIPASSSSEDCSFLIRRARAVTNGGQSQGADSPNLSADISGAYQVSLPTRPGVSSYPSLFIVGFWLSVAIFGKYLFPSSWRVYGHCLIFIGACGEAKAN